MREIKFRAWDGTGQTWLKDSALAIELGGRLLYTVDFPQVQTAESALGKLAEKIVIEQFTGLKDKFGKDIYEGDVVTCVDANGYDHTGEVASANGTFVLRSLKLNWDRKREIETLWKDGVNRWHSIENCDEFEVVGNRHQHPELLNSPDGK